MKIFKHFLGRFLNFCGIVADNSAMAIFVTGCLGFCLVVFLYGMPECPACQSAHSFADSIDSGVRWSESDRIVASNNGLEGRPQGIGEFIEFVAPVTNDREFMVDKGPSQSAHNKRASTGRNQVQDSDCHYWCRLAILCLCSAYISTVVRTELRFRRERMHMPGLSMSPQPNNQANGAATGDSEEQKQP